MKRWLPLFLFLFALLIRLLAKTITHFDGLYGQDPFAYYGYALELQQALAARQAIPPFTWPIGYPLFIIFAMLFVGTQALAGQIVSIIASALMAPLVYWLVRELEPEAVFGAAIAGLLSATAAQFLISSLAVMSDAAGLLWATLSAWALLLFMKRDWQWRWLVITAVTLAFAILTRWVYGLLILPWAVSGLLAAREQQKSRREVALTAVIALTIGLTIIGSQFWAELAHGEFSHAVDLEVVRWHPANAFKTTVQNSDGTFHYERPIALYYFLPTLHPAYIFPLLAPFLLIGLWLIRTRPLSQQMIFIGWFLVIYGFLAGITWQNWRFPLALFPALLVLVGIGLDGVWRQRPSWHKALITLSVLSLLGSLGWAARDLYNFTSWTQSQLAAVHWTEEKVPDEATLIAFGLTASLQHYTDIPTHELFFLNEVDLRELTNQDTPLYLLVDPQNVQSQWQGKSPENNVLWLDEHTDLIQVERNDPYVLYWVKPKPPVTFGTTPLLVAPDK
jgi:4-amino-4-deoxy-L-arabinose transferase-like glycosyltransferase